MLTLGIDDAGRGPLIGPMVLAGVLANKNQERKFKSKNIRDSKDTPHEERVAQARFIKENSIANKIIKISPFEIDSALNTAGTNLNKLEASISAKIINSLNTKKEKIKAIIDCPSTNIQAWQSEVQSKIAHPENIELICEHKADTNHVSVSAASVLAKVTREEAVAKIKKQFGEIGSGYPADPITKEFLKKHGKDLSEEGIFRKSWATWKKLFPERGQATLEGF